MEWNNLKQDYIELLDRQLLEVEATKKAYDYLLENEYSQQEAKEALCVYLHMMTMEILQSKQDFDMQMWEGILQRVYIERKGDSLNLGKQGSVLRRIIKEIGTIPQGEEEDYLDGLMMYENQILSFSEYHGLHSNDISRLVKAWIVKMYGAYKGIVYNQLPCTKADVDEMANLLVMDGDPYMNEALAQSVLENDPDFDLNDQEVKDTFYQSGIQCLLRILDSIDFWNRELGNNGYLKYLNSLTEDTQE